MAEPKSLPAGYEELEPYAALWAHPTEDARNARRWRASAEEFASFYTAMMPRLDAILEELSGYSLDGMDPAQRNLFCLAAAFAEAAPHHELYGGSAAVPHSFSAHRFAPRHGAKESWAASFNR